MPYPCIDSGANLTLSILRLISDTTLYSRYLRGLKERGTFYRRFKQILFGYRNFAQSCCFAVKIILREKREKHQAYLSATV